MIHHLVVVGCVVVVVACAGVVVGVVAGAGVWLGIGEVTLVTLVSQKQPLWRGVTQGGVAPVFPFRANP